LICDRLFLYGAGLPESVLFYATLLAALAASLYLYRLLSSGAGDGGTE